MKRFTETEKWNDGWFRRLTPERKLLWIYLCDRCDAAGVIEMDFDLVEFLVGHRFDDSDMVFLKGRVEPMEGEKWRVLKFIEFQYGALDAKCRGHATAIKAAQKHRLACSIAHLTDRVSDTLSDTLQDRTGQDRTGRRQDEVLPARARVSSGPTLHEAAAWAMKFNEGNAWGMQIAPEVVRGWHDDRSRLGWEIPRGQHMVPIADWQADLRDFTKWSLRSEPDGRNAGKKRTGAVSPHGGEAPRRSPEVLVDARLPEPPCDWRVVLRGLYPPERHEGADYTLPWGRYEPEMRREVVSECRRLEVLGKEWVQGAVTA